MKRSAAALLFPALLATPALADPPAGTHEVREPFADSVWYACGPEEAVQLSGALHRRVWEHTDGNGTRHRHISYNLQGVEGFGTVTGDRYVAVTNETSSQSYELIEDDTQVTVHSVLVSRLIRTGSGDDAWLYFSRDETFVFSSEDPIESRVRFWTDCRG